ncbi:PEP-CTERM sorting domain-containing protein [Thermosulfuriphilus sp.]
MKTRVLILLMCALLLSWAGSANALWITDLFVDVGTDYDGDLNSETGRFDTFMFEDNAKSEYPVETRDLITEGTSFVDYGNVIINHLRSGGTYLDTDDEDMRHGIGDTESSWEMTVTWTGLTGEVNGIYTDPNGNVIASARYTEGVFTMYFDTTPDASFGSDIGPDDDSGFGDGDIVIQGVVIPGPLSTGTATLYPAPGFTLSRNVSLLLEITSVDGSLPAPALKSDTQDLEFLVGQRWLLSLATEAGASGNLLWSGEGDGDNLTILRGSGTGSFQLHAIPEPATLLLVGSGLLMGGLGARRRSKKA